MTPDPILALTTLQHDYGQGPVLDIPHLELPPGRVHLQGPNGAGKTTLLRILATLITPTRGRITLDGLDVHTHGLQARAQLGYAGHAPSLHEALTPRENLALHARLHRLDPARAHASLEAWQLETIADTRVDQLSQGQRRRTDLARATLHDPRVLLLDEPTANLDETATRLLTDAIERSDPALVLVAAHRDPGLETTRQLQLDHGQLQGAMA